MNTKKATYAILAGIAIVLSLSVVVASSMVTPALAKISPRHCENGGGQEPPGQQPTCHGEGLTQEPATNPAGSAPPGQNK